MLQNKTKILKSITGIWLLTSILLCCGSKTQEARTVASDDEELVKVKFNNLTIDPQSKQPVVLLADPDEERALLIWIGFFEARAIHSEMQGIEPFRPLTHDLLKRIIQKTDGQIDHIVITHVKENVFYATIMIKQDGSLIEIDARPSDSIVMALKFKAPIFVAKKLFDDMAISIAEQKEIEEEYGISIQDLSPELAKYLSYPSKQGVLVSDVKAESPAARDGIASGDIIVEIGGETVEDVIFLKNSLAKSDSPVKAKIFRKTRYLSITLHPK
jgi:bifunctional DNase/RNase